MTKLTLLTKLHGGKAGNEVKPAICPLQNMLNLGMESHA